LSLCLGLSDELAEIEMYKAIVVRSPLKDLHSDARNWLKERGVEAPTLKKKKRSKKRKRMPQ
jgi:hypothetical protein